MVMIALLIIIILINGLLAAYTRNVQATTLFLGRELAQGNELAGNTGFQDAITSKAQTIRNYLMFALIFLMALVALLIKWYWIPVALVAWILVQGVSRVFLPKDVLHYANGIGQSLARREADYAKDNDHLRADAARELKENIAQIIPSLKGKKLAELS